MDRPSTRFALFLLAAAGAASLGSRAGLDPLPGDAGFYAAACHSMLHDRDLNLLNQCYPDCATVADTLPELEGEHAGEFGYSVRGELTLKQSPVLALAALPAYAVAGKPGLLAFNVVVLALVLLAAAELVGPPAGVPAALALLVTTPLHRFALNFSPDLFLVALLMAALLAARAARPGWCGLLLGLAVGAKVYVAAMALPVALAAVVWHARPGRATILGLAGGLVGLAPAAAFNAHQYGAPWVTGYERQLKVEAGTTAIAGHVSRFTNPPVRGVADILFDPAVGLVPTAPLFALALPAVFVLKWRNRFRGVPAVCLALLAANVALFCGYDGWHGGSALGNRYLFPALVAGFVLIGSAVNALGSGWFGRAGKSPPE